MNSDRSRAAEVNGFRLVKLTNGSTIVLYSAAIKSTAHGSCFLASEPVCVFRERIHTDNSYKYQAADFVELLQRAGLSRTLVCCDPDNWFAVMLAHP